MIDRQTQLGIYRKLPAWKNVEFPTEMTDSILHEILDTLPTLKRIQFTKHLCTRLRIYDTNPTPHDLYVLATASLNDKACALLSSL